MKTKSCLITILALPGALVAQEIGGSSISAKTYTSADQYIEEIVFDNGLGDIIQEQKIGLSGDAGTAIVTHHDYDEYRRETSVWLPTAVKSSGDYIPRNTLTSVAVSSHGDQKPYSKTTYDEFWPSSPSRQTKAGAQWHDRNRYSSISNLITSSKCVGSYLGSSTLVLQNSEQFYAETITDEDGCMKTTYKDKTGRLRMEETTLGKTIYVYDTRTENLRFVLPPAASKYIFDKLKNTSSMMDFSEVRKLAYEYQYDGLGRCIYKSLPGCEPVHYIYDKAGNCILTQDGEQRKSGEWSFSIPDKFGRPCVTGKVQNTYDYKKEPLKDVFVYAEYTTGSSTYKGYKITGLTMKLASLYTVTYYDSYDFVGKYGMPSAFATEVQRGSTAGNGKGLSTGSVEAYLDASGIKGYNYSVIYYNDKKESVKTGSTNHKGGYSIAENTYSYSGQVLISKVTTKIGSKSYTETYTNEYDRADRLTKTRHKYGSTEVVLLENSYDDLGRLASTKRLQKKDTLMTELGYTLHSSVKSLKTGTLFEEKLHFEDSANGNTPLYSGSISGIEWMVKGSVKRGYNYAYDKNKRLTKSDYYDFVGGEGRFSTSYGYDNMGNITSLKRSGNHNNGGFGVIDNLTYSYNGNQLVSVDDAATSPDINDSFDFKDGADASVEYLYDANGNMIQDKNKGIAEIRYNHLNMPTRITYDNGNMIDYLYSASGAKLKVTHTTNKLLMVNTNIGTGTSGTTIKTKINRLTIDEPSLVRRASTSTTTTSELEIQTTDYINGYILSDGTLSQIQMNGGYMTEDANGKAVYHFYLQDHQGNNRVVVNGSTLAVEQVNHYYPYGGLFAESTGGEKQPFKYNGKELDRMCGLNWYDHGARHNDAAIGRWHCIDPLAEKYYSISPYAYCAGDPVNCVDPDGRLINFVAGAVGAVVGGVIGAGIAWYQNGSTNEIIGAAAGGFVAGGLAGLTMGATLAAGSPLVAYGGSALIGAGSNVIGEIAKESTVSSLNNGELSLTANTDECIKAASIGAAAGVIGAGLTQATQVLNAGVETATSEMTAIKNISSGSRTLRVSVQASSTTKLNASEVTNGVDALKDEAIEFVGGQREVLSVMKYLSSGSEKLFNAAGTYGIDPSTYEKK